MQKTIESALKALEKLEDEDLAALKFAFPWQYDTSDITTKDEDGFNVKTEQNRSVIQKACWDKFCENPHVNTSTRGVAGRLAGFNFSISSDIPKIHEAIESTEYDIRNRLYNYWPKYIVRAIVEGELYLLLSAHDDGFVEVDFVEPTSIAGGGEDGIIYHPMKPSFPLFYFVTITDQNTGQDIKLMVPSIYVAYFPDMVKLAEKSPGYTENGLKSSMSSKSKYKPLGGFTRFIVSWDRSFVTKRNVSYLRTVIEWLNHYENLKKYEIDHKKSAGAYLWTIYFEDPKAFKLWLSLTDEERRKTGILQKKTPGSTLLLPPGMKMEVQNPKLPSISEGDTDIFHMITGGLNEPEDVSSGQSKGTFASVKASRGPMSDRISDEVAYFERFLKYDFYRAVFHIKSKISGFPDSFLIKEAIE